MRRFERDRDGTLVARVEDAELALLATLVQQASDVIAGANLADPAVQRILPDAYPDDPDASAEFRRFTQPDLARRKLANAERMLHCVEASLDGELRLDGSDADAWLRGLTDLRLILASRLGIETDDDADRASDDPVAKDVYDWLGFVQNSLVEALDA